MSVNFRTRMFGGFDREDVVAYIEKIAKENQTQVDELTRTADDLRQQNDDLIQQLAILHRQIENCEDSRRENGELTQQVQPTTSSSTNSEDTPPSATKTQPPSTA